MNRSLTAADFATPRHSERAVCALSSSAGRSLTGAEIMAAKHVTSGIGDDDQVKKKSRMSHSLEVKLNVLNRFDRGERSIDIFRERDGTL